MPNDLEPTTIKNPKTTQPRATNLQVKRMEAGFIGRFFGMGPNAHVNNIAALVMLLCLACGAVGTGFLLHYGKEDKLKDLWICVAPIITLTLGYMFGGEKPKG